MNIGEALEDVEIGFRQLEFAIKLLSYCELGNIRPADFDTDHLVMLEDGSLKFPRGKFNTGDRSGWKSPVDRLGSIERAAVHRRSNRRLSKLVPHSWYCGAFAFASSRCLVGDRAKIAKPTRGPSSPLGYFRVERAIY
jgi:hypothetical protein